MTDRIEGHGGELALAALRAFGVDGDVHALRRRTCSRCTTRRTQTGVPHLRRAPRAVGRVRRRGRRQAAAPPRAGRAHRRPRRHQRHLRPDQRLLQRRAGAWCSAAGRRSSAGARAACRRSTTSRWSRPVTKHAATVSATDDDRRRGARGRADRGADPAPRPGLPRPAAGGDLLAGEADAPGRARRPGARARPRRGRARPAALLAGAAAAGHHRRLRRLRRRRRSPPCARRPRRCGCRCSPTGWAAARCRPSTRSRSPRRAGPRSSGADVVAVDRHPAGLPARLRRLRRRPRSCTSSTRRASGPAHVAAGRLARRRPAADPRRRWPTYTGDRGRPRADWIADAARGRGRRARPRDAEALDADTDPIKPARVYGELRKVLDRGRGDDRRRRRLRLLRRQVPGAGPARHLARPRPVRLPRHRHGLRDGRPGHLPRPPDLRADGRRRGRLLADGRRVAGPAEPAGGHRGRQQRHLGPGEAPHAGDVRLRRGRRPAARPALRRRGAGARRGRRDGREGRPTWPGAAAGPSTPGVPYLVNVLTDPADAYPRSSNLA